MTNAISICVFGSQARGTSDALSDRDVLLVGEESESLKKVKTDWSNRNWNVSMFDRASFARMADAQYLFIQHVKQEGRILCDDGSFLVSILDKYSPRSDYSPERNDALNQIAELPSSIDEYWPDLCLADIIYVLFRNAAILHLATLGEYCFQYKLLVEKIGKLFGLTEEDESSLLTLRELKHGYRKRISGLIVGDTLHFASDIVHKVLHLLPNSNSSSVAIGHSTNEYYLLRLLERRLAIKYDPPYLDSLDPEHSLYDLWQAIINSTGYPKPKIRLH